jgi:hypothetical protein
VAIFVTLRKWAVKDLRRGNLGVLASVSRSKTNMWGDRILRLNKRRFVSLDKRGAVRLTPRGRLALLIHRYSGKP